MSTWTPPYPQLSNHLDHLVEDLQRSLDAACRVESHDGILSKDELKAAANRAPIAMVAITGIPALQQHGRDVWRLDTTMVITLLTRDMPGKRRHAVALDLAGRIVQAITKSGDWGRPDLFRAPEPESIRANNLYSGALDDVQGVSLWGITWTQNCYHPM